MHTEFDLKSMLFIIIAYLSALFLSDLVRQINLVWFFYVIPVFIAAFYYGIVGSLVMGIISFGTLGFWMWYFGILSRPLNTVNSLYEISLGVSVFLIAALVLGYVSRRWRIQEEQLKRFSTFDSTTQLYNYSYFVDRLSEEIDRADRYDYPLSVIKIDVDRFKDFNDTFGNQKGNALLGKMAKIIKRCVRNVDVAARYGAEEFALLLPNVDSDAQVVAERIRKQIENASFEGDVEQPQVRKTVSCGVATYPIDATSDTELIVNADEALSKAKESGRNKVCVYSMECRKPETEQKE